MTEENKVIGNVQWFDQKIGYGFLKIISPDSDYLGKEIFIHYSSIDSESEYKKVFPGENVLLNIHDNGSGGDEKKRYNSMNVTGLYGTPLMVDNVNYIFKVIKKHV